MKSVNENTLKGKWLEIKGEVQKAWGNLTDDELEKTKGDAKAIGGLIQQKYGHSEEKHGKQIDDIFKRFEIKKDETIESVKEKLRN